MPDQASSSAKKAVSRFIKRSERANEMIFNLNLSIRSKILIALCTVIFIMGVSNGVLVAQVLNYSRQYDSIITNITTANSISGNIKPQIDTEMWNIVARKVDFKKGKQYEIIADANTKLQTMIENTDSPQAALKLEGIRRTLTTLSEYVDEMGVQISNKSTAAENEKQLEKIRFASSVVEEVVQEYALFEVNRTESQYRVMREAFFRWGSLSILLILSAILFSVVAAWSLSKSIYTPIKKLHDVTTTITKNDLKTLVTRDNRDEITELGMSFNIMIGKIRELLDSKIKEHENLKKAEMKALQAQINPHFLYNTLDTIIWMAQSEKNEDVIEITNALSQFFRISLSKGRDWITIADEMEQTTCYLTIQKMRYRKILDFKIEMEQQVAQNTVLKLVLQPLVENALYHGIKNKREGGAILVRASAKNDNEILLEVEDNGIGFTPEKLKRLQAELEDDSDDIRMESGFGIGNVNKRIRLYYGKQYGLSVRSEYNSGTCVTLVIPAQKDSQPGNQNFKTQPEAAPVAELAGQA